MKVQILAVALAAILALSGCIATDDGTPHVDTEPEAQPGAGNLTVETLTGSIEQSIATPAISFNQGGTYNFPLDPSPANRTGFVLELTWEASAPNHEELDLWIRDAALGTVPPDDPSDVLANQPVLKATGPSPLRLVVPIEDLDTTAEYSILVRAPTPVGVVNSQSFTLNVATFDGLPVDPEHAFA